MERVKEEVQLRVSPSMISKVYKFSHESLTSPLRLGEYRKQEIVGMNTEKQHLKNRVSPYVHQPKFLFHSI